MTSVGFGRSFTVRHKATDEQLEAHAAALMDALLALETTCDITDSAVSLDVGRNAIEIEVVGSGSDFAEAVRAADSCIRTAIHSAGGTTARWELTTVSEHSETVDA